MSNSKSDIKVITRYGITYLDVNGLRTLFGVAQGRHMFKSRIEAQDWLNNMIQNSENVHNVLTICGEQSIGTFRVDIFPCYESGDPISIYIRE